MELRFSFAVKDHVPAVRVLVNEAYRELSDLGLNYTGTYQNEDQTWERMQNGSTVLAWLDGELVGTVHLREHNAVNSKRAAYISQFAVTPRLKRRGIGSRIMDYVEALAKTENFECLQLDTAKPATHLVRFYMKRGYRIASETHYEGKTYDSWIFEKDIVPGRKRRPSNSAPDLL